jgi:glutamate-5-semialdehyde dehydrogenase
VCNAVETLLVDEEIAGEVLPLIKDLMQQEGVELRGCKKTLGFIDVKKADENDWDTEYLDKILSIKTVSGLDEAVKHIEKHGSGHSDSIITENYSASEEFLNRVDSACVYVNASTRFTDGGEFGFGAEVGISTNKLHARGPMGIDDLTTYKYKIYGNGQIRE